MFGVKMIGNIHTYAKTIQMQSQWRQKQESGELTAKKDPVTGDPIEGQKSVVDLLTMEQPQEKSQADQHRIQEIKNKIQLGSSLTREELEYLREKAPELYEEYMLAEEERKQAEKAYEEALKRCKTQQEVERIKTSALHRSLARAKFVANNPHIPDEKKAALIGAERRKTEDVTRSTEEFVRKGDYAKLPTEYEVVKAIKDDAEDMRERLGISEKAGESKTEKTEAAGESAADSSKEADGDERPEAAGTHRKVCEAETESNAQRKVRRAKAKAVYTYTHSEDKGENDLNTQA